MYNYFITVFNKYDEFGIKDSRCWGYYHNLEDAIDTLTNNITDLWETCYTAVFHKRCRVLGHVGQSVA